MHGDMQYGPMQGQGHEPFKVGHPSIFKRDLHPSVLYGANLF